MLKLIRRGDRIRFANMAGRVMRRVGPLLSTHKVGRAVKHLADLVTDITAYGRPPELTREPTSLNALIEECLSLVQDRVVDKEIRVVSKLAPDVGTVLADARELKKVLLNLFVNALEAMEPHGTLTIRSMLSFEPATVSNRRYPELFQQGETAFGHAIVDGQQVGRPKPDPEGILLALSELNVPAQEALVVGDAGADILAGQSAGAKTALARWLVPSPPYDLPSRPDYTFYSVAEFKTFLFGEEKSW